MSDSPYCTPTPEHTTQEDDNDSAVTSRSLLPFAQLGIRLLGVMLIVDGLGALFGGLIQGLFQAQAYANAGYNVLIDPHSVGWAAGGIPHLITGVYLTVGGNWILRNVFIASRHLSADSFTGSSINSGEPDDARESPS